MYHVLKRLLIATLLTVSIPALAKAQGMELPDGEGKELVQASCVRCHETTLIAGSTGYTHEQWGNLISKMIDLPDPLASGITQYLGTNFPQKNNRHPTLIAGDFSYSEAPLGILGLLPYLEV